MFLRILAAFTILVSSFTHANLLLNKNNYVEIDFSVDANNGEFDQAVNSLSILHNYTSDSFTRGSITEEFDFFDDGQLIADNVPFPGLYADDYRNGGIDFSGIRDGSFKGTLRISAWYENNPDWNVELTDFLSFTLDVCDINGCRYSDTSYITFGEVRLKTVAVPEPSSLGILGVMGLMLLRVKRKQK